MTSMVFPESCSNLIILPQGHLMLQRKSCRWFVRGLSRSIRIAGRWITALGQSSPTYSPRLTFQSYSFLSMQVKTFDITLSLGHG